MIIFTFLNFAEGKKDSHLSLEMAPSAFIFIYKNADICLFGE